MEYVGLFFEFLFLGMGVYLYLYARGLIELKGSAVEFREKNKNWLRPVSLALIAIMTVNIYLHLQQVFGF